VYVLLGKPSARPREMRPLISGKLRKKVWYQDL
jgi:hypothetical protein